MARGNSNPQLNAALTNLTSRVNPPQGLLNANPPGLAPQATTPQIAGLLTPDQPTAAAPPGLLTPDPTPYTASAGDPRQGTLAPPITPDPVPPSSGYGDLPAGPLPAPQIIQPPVYGDKAIGSDAAPIPMSKTVGGITTGTPQAAPHPLAPAPQSPDPDSATPLAQSTDANQQALAAALARLRASQGAPTSLFRRASPSVSYQ